MKKKNFGWVIQDNYTKKFYKGNCESIATASLSEAEIQPTRQEAREDALSGETVRKVSLTKTGKPKAIIGRG